MSDQQNIRLTLGDWQWNASIVGFINILEKTMCILMKTR